ncbi:hypothetical protein P171DRAFT_521881 [Karstenula rhodostoma CBS 690.94]|uniref:Uncharacterized protein n=1 Tax=Karstenula rhodostoma CBS 690.94 TaxID=1392251 RepID=A0A9P4UBG3_9PLEO|nr:hypothetical protein P171DRAFT_521881 [Karstenula rhodostoma CBS 690.94]
MTWKRSKLLSKALGREVQYRKGIFNDVLKKILPKERHVNSNDDDAREIATEANGLSQEILAQTDTNLPGDMFELNPTETIQMGNNDYPDSPRGSLQDPNTHVMATIEVHVAHPTDHPNTPSSSRAPSQESPTEAFLLSSPTSGSLHVTVEATTPKSQATTSTHDELESTNDIQPQRSSPPPDRVEPAAPIREEVTEHSFLSKKKIPRGDEVKVDLGSVPNPGESSSSTLPTLPAPQSSSMEVQDHTVTVSRSKKPKAAAKKAKSASLANKASSQPHKEARQDQDEIPASIASPERESGKEVEGNTALAAKEDDLPSTESLLNTSSNQSTTVLGGKTTCGDPGAVEGNKEAPVKNTKIKKKSLDPGVTDPEVADPGVAVEDSPPKSKVKIETESGMKTKKQKATIASDDKAKDAPSLPATTSKAQGVSEMTLDEALMRLRLIGQLPAAAQYKAQGGSEMTLDDALMRLRLLGQLTNTDPYAEHPAESESGAGNLSLGNNEQAKKKGKIANALTGVLGLSKPATEKSAATEGPVMASGKVGDSVTKTTNAKLGNAGKCISRPAPGGSNASSGGSLTGDSEAEGPGKKPKGLDGLPKQAPVLGKVTPHSRLGAFGKSLKGNVAGTMGAKPLPDKSEGLDDAGLMGNGNFQQKHMLAGPSGAAGPNMSKFGRPGGIGNQGMSNFGSPGAYGGPKMSKLGGLGGVGIQGMSNFGGPGEHGGPKMSTFGGSGGMRDPKMSRFGGLGGMGGPKMSRFGGIGGQRLGGGWMSLGNGNQFDRPRHKEYGFGNRGYGGGRGLGSSLLGGLRGTGRGLFGGPKGYNDGFQKRDPFRRDPIKRDPIKRDPIRRDPIRRDPIRRDPIEGIGRYNNNYRKPGLFDRTRDLKGTRPLFGSSMPGSTFKGPNSPKSPRRRPLTPSKRGTQEGKPRAINGKVQSAKDKDDIKMKKPKLSFWEDLFAPTGIVKDGMQQQSGRKDGRDPENLLPEDSETLSPLGEEISQGPTEQPPDDPIPEDPLPAKKRSQKRSKPKQADRDIPEGFKEGIAEAEGVAQSEHDLDELEPDNESELGDKPQSENSEPWDAPEAENGLQPEYEPQTDYEPQSGHEQSGNEQSFEATQPPEDEPRRSDPSKRKKKKRSKNKKKHTIDSESIPRCNSLRMVTPEPDSDSDTPSGRFSDPKLLTWVGGDADEERSERSDRDAPTDQFEQQNSDTTGELDADAHSETQTSEQVAASDEDTCSERDISEQATELTEDAGFIYTSSERDMSEPVIGLDEETRSETHTCSERDMSEQATGLDEDAGSIHTSSERDVSEQVAASDEEICSERDISEQPTELIEDAGSIHSSSERDMSEPVTGLDEETRSETRSGRQTRGQPAALDEDAGSIRSPRSIARSGSNATAEWEMEGSRDLTVARQRYHSPSSSSASSESSSSEPSSYRSRKHGPMLIEYLSDVDREPVSPHSLVGRDGHGQLEYYAPKSSASSESSSSESSSSESSSYRSRKHGPMLIEYLPDADREPVSPHMLIGGDEHGQLEYYASSSSTSSESSSYRSRKHGPILIEYLPDADKEPVVCGSIKEGDEDGSVDDDDEQSRVKERDENYRPERNDQRGPIEEDNEYSTVEEGDDYGTPEESNDSGSVTTIDEHDSTSDANSVSDSRRPSGPEPHYEKTRENKWWKNMLRRRAERRSSGQYPEHSIPDFARALSLRSVSIASTSIHSASDSSSQYSHSGSESDSEIDQNSEGSVTRRGPDCHEYLEEAQAQYAPYNIEQWREEVAPDYDPTPPPSPYSEHRPADTMKDGDAGYNSTPPSPSSSGRSDSARSYPSARSSSQDSFSVSWSGSSHPPSSEASLYPEGDQDYEDEDDDRGS